MSSTKGSMSKANQRQAAKRSTKNSSGFTKAGRNSRTGGKHRGTNGHSLGGPRVATGNGYGAAEQRNNRQQPTSGNPDRLTMQLNLVLADDRLTAMSQYERDIVARFAIAWLAARVERRPDGKPVVSRGNLASDGVRLFLRANDREKEASSAQVNQLLRDINAIFKDASDQLYSNAS